MRRRIMLQFLPADGEMRVGYATVGVPHLVIQLGDVASADVVGRGRQLRHHPSLHDGANVNFVSRGPGSQWSIRTYERGVEDETLACGTGNVAAAVLLSTCVNSADTVELLPKSSQVSWRFGSVRTPRGGLHLFAGKAGSF